MLIVENDPAMREAFGMLLRGWGMEVADAAGVADARAAATGVGARPRADRLPAGRDETGVQVIEAIRHDLGAPVPALIVSAEEAAAIRRLADPLGVPVLQKPVAEGTLRRAFRELLEGTA